MPFLPNNPTTSDIMEGKTLLELACQIKELQFQLLHTTGRDTIMNYLIEKNYHQAAMLMEKDAQMLKLVVDNKTEEEELKQPVPKTAGKGPTDGDYLSSMISGTEFLVRHRTGSTFLLNEFTHGGKKQGAVLLLPTATLQDTRTWIWVDPTIFCQTFEFRGILEIPEEE